MPSTYADRLRGLTTSVAVKAPCRVATGADIMLAGHQSIDGVPTSGGMRVLVRAQFDPEENGIWLARTGEWDRALDFNGVRDVVNGTTVYVTSGSRAGQYVVTAVEPIEIGETPLTITLLEASGSGAGGTHIRPEDFELGSDGANIAAAIDLGISSGAPVDLDGAYSLSAPLSTFEMTTERLTVGGNGLITLAGDFAVPAISFHATYPTPVAISAIVQLTYTFPGGAAAQDATRVAAPGHACEIGDLVKLVADDLIAISPSANCRIGEFAYVADVSGNFLYFAGRLINSYATTPRLVRVRTEPKLVWSGPRFAASEAQTGWDSIMLQVRGFVFPRIRTICEDGYDIGVNVSSCFMAQVDVAGRNFRNRVDSEGVSGYLVQDSASAFTHGSVNGVDARHLFTTDSPTSGLADEPYLYGQTIGFVIGGAGYGCSAAAFDTHPEAIDGTFANISGGRTRIGESASGALIGLRGIRNRAIVAIDRGSSATVQFFAMTVGGCIDCEAHDINYVGTGDGVRIGDSGSESVTRPRVRGGLIRTSKARSVAVFECVGAEIDDLTITPTGSVTHEGIVLVGDSDLLVRRLTIDLADYGGTAFRAFAFTAGSTGNVLRVERARVINGAGKFASWLHAHSAVGDVVLGELASDVPPTVGAYQGIENLDSFQLSDGWALIEEWTYASDVSTVNFTGIAHDEVRVMARNVTKASTGTLNLRVSANNGSSYQGTSGDYVAIAASGQETALTGIPMHDTDATAARSGSITLSGLRSNQKKVARAENRAAVATIETLSVVNALRVYPSGGGNITGGTITVYGR